MTALFDRLPGWIKYPLIALLLIVWTPIQVYRGVDDFVISRAVAVVAPMMKIRDLEMKHTNEKLNSIDRKLDILIQRTK